MIFGKKKFHFSFHLTFRLRRLSNRSTVYVLLASSSRFLLAEIIFDVFLFPDMTACFRLSKICNRKRTKEEQKKNKRKKTSEAEEEEEEEIIILVVHHQG